MSKDRFVDGVTGITITGNTIRLDLMTIQPHLKAEGQQAVFEVVERIIMPLDGFFAAFTLQENFMKQLIDAGVVTRKEPVLTPSEELPPAAAEIQIESATELPAATAPTELNASAPAEGNILGNQPSPDTDVKAAAEDNATSASPEDFVTPAPQQRTSPRLRQALESRGKRGNENG